MLHKRADSNRSNTPVGPKAICRLPSTHPFHLTYRLTRPPKPTAGQLQNLIIIIIIIIMIRFSWINSCTHTSLTLSYEVASSVVVDHQYRSGKGYIGRIPAALVPCVSRFDDWLSFDLGPV